MEVEAIANAIVVSGSYQNDENGILSNRARISNFSGAQELIPRNQFRQPM
jgi:hypothetical protein